MMGFCYISKGIFKYRKTLGLSIYLPGLIRLDEDKVSSVWVSWKEKLLFVEWKDSCDVGLLFESSYDLNDCRLSGPKSVFELFSDVNLDYLASVMSELPF